MHGSDSTTSIRLAISQPAMHRQVAEHVGEVERALRAAAEHEADLVLFPELMLTGLHREVPALLERAVLERSVEAIGAMCREYRIAAALGTPVWVDDGKPYDAMVVLNALGEQILMAPKLRLMPPGEPLLFEAGKERRVIPYGDSSLGVVMCREIFDQKDTARELGGRARIILWPGSIVRGPVDPTNPEDVTRLAQQLASDQNACVYHSNWAFNVEAPSLPNTGRSFSVSSTGRITIEAPPQVEGLLLTWEPTLAAAWIPEAAL